jgi:hypothetical protein
MADIKIKIDLQSTTEDNVEGVSASQSVVNVSKNVSKNTTSNSGVSGLSFAKEYLTFKNGYLANYDGTIGMAQMEKSYNGFMFGATNDNGEYSVTLTITGTNIDSLIFYGDKTAKQFPIEAYLDGNASNKIYNDDYEWAVKFSSAETSHTITFTKWNRPNYNACLTHLAVMMNELWLDKSWIKNVESLSQSTAQPNEIFYGVLPNTGSAEIIDRNGEILDYLTDGIIENSNLPITIYANGKEVQHHIINDSDYDKNTITFSVQMTNELEQWETLQYGGYVYPGTSKSAYELLKDVFLSIGYSIASIDGMVDTRIVVGNSIDNNVSEMTVKEYLQAIDIPYPYLESDNVKNTIDKICTLAQLQVFNNNINEIKFNSARPKATLSELNSPIILTSKCEQSVFCENKILKNKISDCFIQYRNVNLSYNTLFEKLITMYNKSSYTTSYSNYTNILSASSYNQDITVLANHIISDTVISKKWYYSLVKYEYKNEHSGNLYYNSFKWNDGWTYWLSGQNEQQLNGNLQTVSSLYDSSTTDNTVASEWANIVNGIITTAKNGCPNSDVSIRINDNDTITVFLWFLCDIANSDNTVYAVYNIHNFVVYRSDYSVSYNDAPDNYDFMLPQVEVLQQDTLFNNTQMHDIIKNNIKSDYVDGISNSTITVSCGDYYNSNGIKVKTWSQGDLLEVGDIVRIDKDNNGNSASVYSNGTPKIWRVTGRRFRKQGVPLIDLELQEINQN